MSLSWTATSADTATTADETRQRLPEVGGACAVEKESRRKVAVVEKLNELLPDERVQRHLLVAQRDDEGVDAKRVAGQVESDEHGGDDEKSLCDAKLCLVAPGQHAPRLRCSTRRWRSGRGVTGARRGARRRGPQHSRYTSTRYAQIVTLRSPSNHRIRTSVYAGSHLTHLKLVRRGAVGVAVVGGVRRGAEAPGCCCCCCCRWWCGPGRRRTAGVLTDLDTNSGVHHEDYRHRDDHDDQRVNAADHLNTTYSDIYRRAHLSACIFTRHWRICAIGRSRCASGASGRSLVGAVIDRWCINQPHNSLIVKYRPYNIKHVFDVIRRSVIVSAGPYSDISRLCFTAVRLSISEDDRVSVCWPRSAISERRRANERSSTNSAAWWPIMCRRVRH